MVRCICPAPGQGTPKPCALWGTRPAHPASTTTRSSYALYTPIAIYAQMRLTIAQCIVTIAQCIVTIAQCIVCSGQAKCVCVFEHKALSCARRALNALSAAASSSVGPVSPKQDSSSASRMMCGPPCHLRIRCAAGSGGILIRVRWMLLGGILWDPVRWEPAACGCGAMSMGCAHRAGSCAEV